MCIIIIWIYRVDDIVQTFVIGPNEPTSGLFDIFYIAFDFFMNMTNKIKHFLYNKNTTCLKNEISAKKKLGALLVTFSSFIWWP